MTFTHIHNDAKSTYAQKLSVKPPKSDEVKRWLDAINVYEKQAESWIRKGKKIQQRYKDERDEGSEDADRFNILWSNIETLKPFLYAQSPKPEVAPRFNSDDPVARKAAEVLEHATAYYCQTEGFGSMMRQAVLDYLLPGRGTVWVRYVPHFRVLNQPAADVQITDDEVIGDSSANGETEGEPLREVYKEEVSPDFVHWQDFGHTWARTWEEVTAVWRKSYLTRKKLIERFGEEKGKAIQLDYNQKDLSDTSIGEQSKRATIYEIWDKDTLTVYWLHKESHEIIDQIEDPLRLDKFFPCPKPLLATTANDSIIPVPDYQEYQDQARELDTLTARINLIVPCIKVAGVRDASAQALDRLLSEGVENKLVPVDQWAVFAEKGGIKGSMDLLPMEEIAKVLVYLYDAREKTKQVLYEITGLADIIRGSSHPTETATAQRIKSNFATMRLDERQREVQRFARNIVDSIGQVIAQHFSIESIKKVSGVKLLTQQEKTIYQQEIAAAPGQPVPDKIQELLGQPTWDEIDALFKDPEQRCFKIDIETDSTLAADDQGQKQEANEFLTAISTFLKEALPIAQTVPELVPLLGKMMMFTVRAYRGGRGLETAFDDAIKKLEAKAKNPPAQHPNPAMLKLQSDQQIAQQKLNSDAQAKQQELQMDQQMQTLRMQSEERLEQQRMMMEARLKQSEAALNHSLEQQRMTMQAHFDAQLENAKRLTDLLIAKLNNTTKIEVAEVAAGATLDAAQINAAHQETQNADL